MVRSSCPRHGKALAGFLSAENKTAARRALELYVMRSEPLADFGRGSRNRAYLHAQRGLQRRVPMPRCAQWPLWTATSPRL